MPKNIAKATVIMLALLFASTSLIALQANAQTTLPAGVTPTNVQKNTSIPLPAGATPDVSVDTNPTLSFRPNPVGVGQTICVNVWVANVATHAARQLAGYKITITKPDGTTDVKTLDSYIGDATAWFEYVVDQVGTWTLKFEFPGGYFPAGNYTVPAQAFIGSQTVSFTKSAYYKPGSTGEQKLTVQQDPILSWPTMPLPTDYWTRPISSDHREWNTILGDYPWNGPGGGPNWPADTNPYWSSNYRFTPYVQGPNSAHIVWKHQDAIGGIMGASSGQLSYPLAIIGMSNFPRIVYAGRCYEATTKVVNGNLSGVWQCYDLRTGEIHWEQPLPSTVSVSSLGATSVSSVSPNLIEYYLAAGEAPGADSWLGTGTTTRLLYIGGGRLVKYDPWTGAIMMNVSISPLTSATYYMNGYCLSVQNLGSGNYRLINWTTLGLGTNFTARIKSNISYALSSIPGTTDFNTGVAVSISSPTEPALGASYQTVITAVSLTTGQMLWNKTYPGSLMLGSEVADHGKIAFVPRGSRHCVGYDLLTGNLAWDLEELDYPWGDWLSYTGQSSAYGLFYICGYNAMYAFNWADGKLAWKYYATAQNPYESAYTDANGGTVYSFAGPVVIADGKVYAYNSEHTVTQPITRGWGLHCINALTGEGIWNITGVSTPGPVSDGYLTAGSMQDGYMYVFGKGKSQTTVTAPDIVIPKGTGVVIRGTVLDMSPAQPGTPCVSKDSMATQMEYIHMQMPQDGLNHDVTVTGVPVTLMAFDSTGEPINIGTATSDVSGTFSYTWTPPNEGNYKITASFTGDDSYGSSWAETAISVGPAPTTTTDNQQEITVPDTTMTIVYGVIAIIIAVVISVAIATILILRKK